MKMKKVDANKSPETSGTKSTVKKTPVTRSVSNKSKTSVDNTTKRSVKKTVGSTGKATVSSGKGVAGSKTNDAKVTRAVTKTAARTMAPKLTMTPEISKSHTRSESKVKPEKTPADVKSEEPSSEMQDDQNNQQFSDPTTNATKDNEATIEAKPNSSLARNNSSDQSETKPAEEPEGSAPKEVPQFTVRPPTGIRDRTARPTTARAAPPRVIRKAEEVIDSLEKMDTQIKSVESVITEGEADKTEDDLFLVEENIHDGDQMSNPDGYGVGDGLSGLSGSITAESERGSLVKQLIETRKQLEGGEDETNIGHNMGTIQSINQLKNSIQTFTRFATPLATILDYLQQHINSMISEYNESNSQYRQNVQKLKKQKSLIDSELNPLREQLRSLEGEIKNVIERNEVLKANIIRNEEKCRKILYRVLETA